MTTYDWKRFWHPQDANVALADSGFLYNPEDEYGAELSPQCASLDAFADQSVLVLLGEPGMGKSTAIESEMDRISATSTVWMNKLGDSKSEDRIVRSVFEHSRFKSWENSDDEAVLFLDGLDEGILNIRTLVPTLIEEFRTRKEVCARLRLRIACRSTEWSQRLETALQEIWGNEQVRTLVLAPLRRKDVEAAAQAESVFPEKFLAAIFNREVQPLANRPVTLKFLLHSFKKSGKLPESRFQLYEEGCLHLCEESSRWRQEMQLVGELGTAKRINIASRIAAFSIFCGSPVMSLEAGPLSADGAIALRDLASGEEVAPGVITQVTEHELREVLQTGIFSRRENHQVGFAHHTYAEFLAARFLAENKLAPEQVESLIFHPDDEKQIVPQLSEVAAWIAAKMPSVFGSILSQDPIVLLRGDFSGVTNDEKAHLIDGMIERMRDGRLGDLPWSLSDYLGKLDHPAMGQQLRQHIVATDEPLTVRRFAILLADLCNCEEVADSLLAVALEPTEGYDLRQQAIGTLCRIANDETLAKLREIAIDNAMIDPEDELKGLALAALWPRRLLTADEMFGSLTKPRNRNRTGSYEMFLKRVAVDDLRPEELAPALRWCIKLAKTKEHLHLGSDSVIMRVVRHSLSNLDKDEVFDFLSRLFVVVLRRHYSVGLDESEITAIGDEARRRILAAVIGKLESPLSLFGLFLDERGLIRPEDFEWLLSQSDDAATTLEKKKWANLAFHCFHRTKHGVTENLCQAFLVNEYVRREFFDSIGPVKLSSRRAERMRRRFQNDLAQEQEIERINALSRQQVSPNQLVADGVEGDFPAFVERWFDEFGNGRLDFRCSLSEFPHWKQLESEGQARVLEAANSFVNSHTPNPSQWSGRGISQWPDMVWYIAAATLHCEDTRRTEGISDEMLSRLVPCVLGAAGYGMTKPRCRDWHQRILDLAQRRSPHVLLEWIPIFLERENLDSDLSQPLSIMSLAVEWPDELSAMLLSRVKDGSLKPSFRERILFKLLLQKYDDARVFTRQLLAAANLNTDVVSPDVLAAFLLVMENEDWEVLEEKLQQSSESSLQVFDRLSDIPMHSPFLPTKLGDNELARYLRILLGEIERRQDQLSESIRWRQKNLRRYCEYLIQALVRRGTSVSLTHLEDLRTQFPHAADWDHDLRQAKKNVMESNWRPLTIDAFRELLSKRSSRLVRTDRELLDVVMESLHRLQARLLLGEVETPAVRDLWDKTLRKRDEPFQWYPVEENELSDYVKRHLQLDLSNLAVVPLREVEIKPTSASTGERTDIYITAASAGERDGNYGQAQVIIETKGCWNKDVDTAMKNQLRDGYLKEHGCTHGVYLVGWFLCNAWTDEDNRRRTTKQRSLEQVRKMLEAQAKGISTEKFQVRSFVLDARISLEN